MSANWGQTAPGHPDVDLCDLRNNINVAISSYPSGYKVGLRLALSMVNQKIEHNELNRERQEWARKAGMIDEPDA